MHRVTKLSIVPLYYFYPSIEGFLDTAVKRSILQAKDNPSLKDFDTFILQTLFMIRYIDEIIKGTRTPNSFSETIRVAN